MQRFSGIVESSTFRRVFLLLALTLIVRPLDLAQNTGNRHHAVTPPLPGKFPQASDDHYIMRRGNVLTVSAANGVLANDTDPVGKPLTATLIAGATHGAIFLNADGSFTYANDGTAALVDSFTYSASDGVNDSTPARVTIDIIADRAPLASNDSYTTAPGVALTIAAPGVLGNDNDPDGDSMTAALVSGVSHGTLTLNPNGSFTYTSDSTATTSDSFTYSASDGTLTSNTATVSIAIDSSVHANADTFPAAQNTPRVVDASGVLANDLLNGSKIVSYGSQTGSEQTQVGASTPTTSGGTVALNADGSLRFNPAPNFAGADTFKYTLANAASKSTAIVLMMVFAPPVASADSYTLTSSGTTVAKPGVLSNDVLSGATITGYGAVTGTEQTTIGTSTATAKGGSIVLRADGSFAYTPPATLNGTDSFRYTISNYAGASPATVTLAVSATPVAVADGYQAAANTSRTVAAASGVLANDTANGATIASFGVNGNEQSSIGSATATARGGAITLNEDGSFTYSPPAGFTGADTFKYTLTSAAGSSTTIVIITVFQPPAAANDSYQGSPNATKNVSAVLGVLANDSPNGATISGYGATAASQTTKSGQSAQTSRGGALVLNGDGSFSYTPPANFNGSDSFAYTLANFAGSSVATVTIAVSTLPVAVNDSYQSSTNVLRTIPAASGVLANDTANGAAIVSYGARTGLEQTVIGAATPTAAGNSIALNADGSFTYTAAAFIGTDSFKYKLSNTAGASTAAVLIAVAGAPLAVNDNYAVPKNTTASSGAPGVLINDTLAGGAIASYGASIGNEQTTVGGSAPTAQGGTITLNGDGSFSYNPPPNFLGTDTFRYVLSNFGGRSTATVTFTISSSPIALNDSYVAVSAAALSISAPGVLTNDALNGGSITSFGVTGTEQTALGKPAPTATGGSITLNADGSFSYTPPLAAAGNDSFHYVLTNASGSSTATVTIIVSLNCTALTITPATLPAATANTVYGPVIFTQSGGVTPIAWSVSAGTLPGGIALTSAGVLSGTTASTGTFIVTIKATDANGCSGTQVLSLVVNCATMIIKPASIPAAVTGVAYPPVTFSQSGGAAPIIWSSGPLPAGMTFSGAGVLTGTPTAIGSSVAINITATDANGCSVTQALTMAINCATMTITPTALTPATTGTASSTTFNQTGGVAPVHWTESGTLPPGMAFSSAGVLSGTATQTGTSTITVTATDANSCTSSVTLPLVINCATIAITPGTLAAGTAGVAYPPVSFAQTGGAGTIAWSSGTLPPGMALTAGVLSGTPTAPGTYNVTIRAADANLCAGSTTLTLVINCPALIAITPSTTIGPKVLPSGITGTLYSSVTFTQSGGVGPVVWSVSAGSIPAGMTLSSGGVLSGTPLSIGNSTFTVKISDANGCSGTLDNLSLAVAAKCPSITIAPSTLSSGSANVAYRAISFSSTGGVAPITWSSASLPAGMTFSGGVLSGTPTTSGVFNVIVTATDANSCSATSSLQLTIDTTCPAITIAPITLAAGVADTAFTPATLTATGGASPMIWSVLSGTLPAGMGLSSAGVLSGTPTQTGSFTFAVKATDANGCFATQTNVSLVITPKCPAITIATAPATLPTATAGSPYAGVTFTQSGGVAPIVWSSGALPAGMIFKDGTLSGTPTVSGTFNITVQATDANSCIGTRAVQLVVDCPTITIAPSSIIAPATLPGGAIGVAYTAVTFSSTGGVGTMTWTLAPTTALPQGMTFSTVGSLSGTPVTTSATGFTITVKATDANGCSGTATYSLPMACQSITVNNPATTTGTVTSPFTAKFTQTGGLGAITFATTVWSLPAGLSLSTDGTLTGTPTVAGTFPIFVTATDANGCKGTGVRYDLVIACNTLAIANPAVTTGTAGVNFTQTFTASGVVGTVAWSKSGTLPNGIVFTSAEGTLSGGTTEVGSFSIMVKATDTSGCTGTSNYTFTINCPTITITNPAVVTGTAGVFFTQTFTATGIVGTNTWTESGALPAGIALHPTTGVLSGTTDVTGSFPIVVKATDTNGCFTTSNYTLTIDCQTITITNPATTGEVPGVAFMKTFAATGILGTKTWSENGALPAGVTLNAATGVLGGTATVAGSFPIVVKTIDTNGCSSTSAYTLTIACNTITVTNPAVNSGAPGTAFSQTFTVTGILGTVTWSESGPLPSGITLNSATGVLSGTPNKIGAFPIMVTATDTNGCSKTNAYTLTIGCSTGIAKPSTTSGTVDSTFLVNFTQSGGVLPVVFKAVTDLASGFSKPAGVAVDDVGTIYVADTDNNSIKKWTASTDNVATTVWSTGLLRPAGVAIDMFGNLYIADTGNSAVKEWIASLNSLVTRVTSVDVNHPGGVAVTRDGSAIFIADTSNNAIRKWTSAGVTTLTVPGLLTPSGVAVDLSGNVYIADTGNSAIRKWTPSGVTTLVSSSEVNHPLGVAADDAGNVYIADTGNNAIKKWTASTGLVTTLFDGLSSPSGVAVDAKTGKVQAIADTNSDSMKIIGTPPGLTLSSTGELSGTPTQKGTFALTTVVTDANGCSARTATSYDLTIGCQSLTINNPSTDGTAGTSLSKQFIQTGGAGTIIWSETGALPSGISFDTSTGVLSGTPLTTGSFPLVVKATDRNGCFASSTNYTLIIACQDIVVFGPGLLSLGFGVDYTRLPLFQQTGAIGTATFSVTSGSLPRGLTLSSDGTVSGTPNQLGVFTFEITATDSNGCTGRNSFALLVVN